MRRKLTDVFYYTVREYATKIFTNPKIGLHKPKKLCYDALAEKFGTESFGLVAQLGERTVRIRKVEGSIPFESTK